MAPAVAGAQTNISLAWDSNPEPDVIGYRLHVGTSPSVYTQTIDVGSSTSYRFQTGTAGVRYYFAVSAYESGPLEGPRSAEVSGVFEGSTTGGTSSGGSAGGSGSTSGGGGGGSTGGGGGGSTGGGGGTPPSSTAGVTAPVAPAPSGPAVVLQPANVSGSTVSLSWMPVGGLVAVDYVVEAGSATGISNLYNASVGLTTSVSANVGLGSYFVRVRGRSASGTMTAPSNEVSFTIGGAGITGCSAPPAIPIGVFGSVVNGVASVGWMAVAGAESYLVQAGSAPGLSDIYYGNVGAATLVSAPVQTGFRAFVRVVSVNACGQSAASSELFIQ